MAYVAGAHIPQTCACIRAAAPGTTLQGGHECRPAELVKWHSMFRRGCPEADQNLRLATHLVSAGSRLPTRGSASSSMAADSPDCGRFDTSPADLQASVL